MRPIQRRRTNDRFMRFDTEERHQVKKLYSNSKNFYDLNGGSAGKLVSVHYPIYGRLYSILLQ